MEKANGEMKAKPDKDMDLVTGVEEGHGASSSTGPSSTGSGINRVIFDADHGDARDKCRDHWQEPLRVNRVVELVPLKAVVKEMDEDFRWTRVGDAGSRPTSGWSRTDAMGENEPAEAEKL